MIAKCEHRPDCHERLCQTKEIFAVSFCAWWKYIVLAVGGCGFDWDLFPCNLKTWKNVESQGVQKKIAASHTCCHIKVTYKQMFGTGGSRLIRIRLIRISGTSSPPAIYVHCVWSKWPFESITLVHRWGGGVLGHPKEVWTIKWPISPWPPGAQTIYKWTSHNYGKDRYVAHEGPQESIHFKTHSAAPQPSDNKIQEKIQCWSPSTAQK